MRCTSVRKNIHLNPAPESKKKLNNDILFESDFSFSTKLYRNVKQGTSLQYTQLDHVFLKLYFCVTSSSINQ